MRDILVHGTPFAFLRGSSGNENYPTIPAIILSKMGRSGLPFGQFDATFEFRIHPLITIILVGLERPREGDKDPGVMQGPAMSLED